MVDLIVIKIFKGHFWCLHLPSTTALRSPKYYFTRQLVLYVLFSFLGQIYLTILSLTQDFFLLFT